MIPKGALTHEMISRVSAPILVSSLRHMPEQVVLARAGHLVSVINAHMMPLTPPSIDPRRHLKLAINEIAETEASIRHPVAAHIEQLIAFLTKWNRVEPLLIHCFAGLSRSTAAAYIGLCALEPETPETLLAHRLRQASETAAPNRIMVAVADHLLQRGGRMAAAIDLIGPGMPAAEGRPFSLTVPAARPGAVAAREDEAPSGVVVALRRGPVAAG